LEIPSDISIILQDGSKLCLPKPQSVLPLQLFMTHARVRKLTKTYDTVGENTAPLTQNPPPVDEQTRNQIAEAAAANDGSAGPKVKSEKECT
jgi:hypothetical protein